MVTKFRLKRAFGAGQEGRRAAKKTRLNSVVVVKTEKPYAARGFDVVMLIYCDLNYGEDLSGLSYNAGAWAKFGRPKKRLRFLRAAEFGRARMTEQGPQGPQRFLR